MLAFTLPVYGVLHVFLKNDCIIKKIKTAGLLFFVILLTFPNFLFYEYYQGPPNLSVTTQALDIEFLKTVIPFFTNLKNIIFYFLFPLVITLSYYRLSEQFANCFNNVKTRRNYFYGSYLFIILISLLANEIVYKARRNELYIFENNPYHILYRLYFVELNPYKSTHLNLGQSVVSKITNKDFENAKLRMSEYEVQNKEFPFMRYMDDKVPFIQTQLGARLDLKENTRPNMVFLVLESLSTIHINEKTMPFLSSFASKHHNSVIFNNFFATSTQTVKGQYTIFCGNYPTFNGKIATDYLKLKVHCMPHILKPQGYYFEANNAVSKNFHNKHYFFEEILAFDKMRGIEAFDQEKLVRAAWGGSDLSSIKDMLDRIRTIKRPYVFQFMSVNYHGPYKLPPDYEEVISDKQKLATLELGDQILYYLDASLAYFFDEAGKIKDFENTIFVITADTGGGQKYKKKLSSFELFELRNKIPLIIYSPLFNKLKKSQEINSFHNQFEIVPLLMDLLKIRSKNHFIGLNPVLYDENSVKEAKAFNSYMQLDFPNIVRTLGRQLVYIDRDKLLMTEGISQDYLKFSDSEMKQFSENISNDEKKQMVQGLRKSLDFWLNSYMPYLHFNKITD